jgi:two-component system, sensor histidine kinase PdtaS
VDEALQLVISGKVRRLVEVEANGAVLALRVIPLNPGGDRIGALVLCRDVTEVRRRERELLTKDATIREIHHRVKNNLQTVAALLRLQARRLDSPEARGALQEAVARVGSIAVVHEMLSHTADDTVNFDDVVDQVQSMVIEVSADAHIKARRVGSFGLLDANVATPLAMSLTELMQNAVEHGIGAGEGELAVEVDRRAGRLRVVVADDGKGLPGDFDSDASERLGLQIVRTLVVGELGGTLELGDRPGGGTQAVIDLPMPA